MRIRSRYADRYHEFRQERPFSFGQAETIRSDSFFLNIANGRCGDVTVSCWPTPEGVEGGRAWGKMRDTNVAIMPFRTKAATTSPTVKLETFELEVFFCEPDLQGSGPTDFPAICRNQQCVSHAEVSLVNLPAPEHVTQDMVKTTSHDTNIDKPWLFRSEEIQDCDGLARAARWIWDAKGNGPVVLHGGVAFRHVQRPLIVACRVRGKAFIELPDRRLRIRYQFSNEESMPKWWAVIPQMSSDDLTQSVLQLEDMVQGLNTKPRGAPSAPTTTPGMDRSQSHNFGATTISGPAHVVMGDVHFGYQPHTFRQDAGWPQFDPLPGTDTLSRNMM